MAYPKIAQQPTMSGVFIPEIWSGKLQVKYYDSTVLSQISNTDYEGEIKNQGDKVIIRTLPTLEINDYVAGQTLTHQRPTSGKLELLIDRGKYWSVIADDVLERQKDVVKMDKWAEDASEQMKITIDTDVLNALAPDVAAANKGATAGRLSGDINLGAAGAPVGLTKTNIIDYLIDLGQVLDEQNVPETGRYIIMPVWATSMLKKSDLKDASLTGDSTSVLRNGRLGMIDRFTLYNSNLLNTVVDGATKCTNILAGHKDGLTFATQMTKLDHIQNVESTFGQMMRGLNVFGFKVIKPEALSVLYAYKA